MQIGLPEKMQMQNHGSYVEITRKWFGFQTIILTAFVLFWDSFLLFWYSEVLQQGAGIIFILFPLLHVGVGVGLTYYLLASWFNTTHVYIGNLQLGIRHRPIPWFGNKDVPAGNLAQLYSKEKISYSKNGRRVSFEVRANTKDGRNIKILGGLESQEQALYIEQQVEKYLHIRDAPVPGEIKA